MLWVQSVEDGFSDLRFDIILSELGYGCSHAPEMCADKYSECDSSICKCMEGFTDSNTDDELGGSCKSGKTTNVLLISS